MAGRKVAVVAVDGACGGPTGRLVGWPSCPAIGSTSRSMTMGRWLSCVRISDAARAWLAQHVGAPEQGGIYTCEPRMAQDILQAAARDLLSWQ